LEPQACLELGHWYKALAMAASGLSKMNLAQRAQTYYRQYLTKAPTSTGVERLQLEQARAAINAAVKELGIAALQRQLTLKDPSAKQAFDKGVAWLWSAQDASSGFWSDHGTYYGSRYSVDTTVAATWALVEATGSVGDPRIARALRYLNLHNTPRVKGVATRLCLWATCERVRPGAFGRYLNSDLRVLTTAAKDDAAYGYSVRTGPHSSGGHDSGHTAYGQMGVAAATAAGHKPPPRYWTLVRDYWAKNQNEDGGWGYGSSYSGPSTRTSSGQCTFAAVGNLAFALQQIHGDASLATMPGTDYEPLRKAMKWMDQFAGKAIADRYSYGPGPWHETYLFLGRAGRLLGRTKFGGVDWFEQGAKDLVKRQSGDGSWGGTIATAWAVLFFVNGGRTAEAALPAAGGGN
jgi:hypothetical protein